MAEDRFETYYAEKIWEMIPAIYRHEDGLGSPPGVLRALVEVIASQAAVLRRDHDRLWDDQFIDLADDWAVPYLGDLLGTRLVSALNRRGRRVDVAKTIYYRRRKGTLAVLEELASDIAGWDGTVVEGFARLGRARHRLDPQVAGPEAVASPATHPGGWADLRRPRIAELAGGPFEECFHLPDVRKPRGRDGRYGISRLNFHLYRIPAMPLAGVMPRLASGTAGFTVDPSGRDIPLFAPRGRSFAAVRAGGTGSGWHRAREWEIAAPISCRLLGHAEFEITEALILALTAAHGLGAVEADELRGRRGQRFGSERRLRRTLASLPASATFLAPAFYRDLAAGALVEDCGKAALLPAFGQDGAVAVDEAPGVVVARELTTSGNLAAWNAAAPGKNLVIDPVRGRVLFLAGAPAAGSRISHHYGFPGEIGAGGFDRREVEERTPDRHHQGGGTIPASGIENSGVTQIDDSATYGPVGNKSAVANLTLQAANQERPYLELAGDWVLSSGANEDAELLLDGLWIGTQAAPVSLILRGDYERVTLRHVTLDPGGARGIDGGGGELPAVSLLIEGHIEELHLDACVTGPVRTAGSGVVERLKVNDSILQVHPESGRALSLPTSEVELDRVTVLGGMDVLRLWASEALVTGDVDTTDTQEGCFRFSAAPPSSRLPRPYQSHTLSDSRSLFTSRRFGDPGYAQLAATAPRAIARGAENGSELGAWSALLNPIKLDSLRAKVEEFSPFGRIPVFLLET